MKIIIIIYIFFFFFQAEAGIRAFHVTGVQTCALPILPAVGVPRVAGPVGGDARTVDQEEVGHIPAGASQRGVLSRDREPLRAGAQDSECGPAAGVLGHVESFLAGRRRVRAASHPGSHLHPAATAARSPRRPRPPPDPRWSFWPRSATSPGSPTPASRPPGPG